MRFRILIGIILLVTGLPRYGIAQGMLPDTICEDTGIRTYFVTGWPGSTYTWTVEGGTIVPPGNTDTITVNWSGIPPGIYLITVTEHAQTGCSGDPFSSQVYIMPAPEVSLQPCISVTSRDARPYILRGGIPLNGLYSGTGIQGGVFDPGVVPPGQDTVLINYYYTNAFGCMDSASAVISILPSSNHTCGDQYTDMRDHQVYGTLLFGTKCWMTQNLNYGAQIPGTEYQRDNCSPEKFCYNETDANCTSFGGLYQWDELMEYAEVDTVQGLCPPGWHVPKESEWQELIALFQDAAHAGTDLKSTGASGFNALLQGFYFNPLTWKYGDDDTILHSTLFWSSTLSGPGKARAHGLNTVLAEPAFTTSISTYSSSRANALSVRCVKD
ncbi:MAG: hypothetical protein HQ542_08170 [Bacteroidia bacterium]|nr:hypothetical protein [Bacteroidia bacterium]